MERSMVAIVCPRNGVGLEREGRILQQILPNSTWYDGRSFDPHYARHPKTIHCEVLRRPYLIRRSVHYFYPDPEWFDMAWVSFKPLIHQVLCKTHHAVTAFRDWNPLYVGCTSPDRYLPIPRTATIACFTGHSQYKNAGTLIETWNRYRDLPPLHLYSASHDYRPFIKTDNIYYTHGYLSDETMCRLQNTHRYHLCISNAEGFGHYINEAMSCDATILTMNGDPMRELTSEFLAEPVSERTLNKGVYYTTTPDNIYVGVKRMLDSQPSQHNREIYLQRDRLFRGKIKEILA